MRGAAYVQLKVHKKSCGSEDATKCKETKGYKKVIFNVLQCPSMRVTHI